MLCERVLPESNHDQLIRETIAGRQLRGSFKAIVYKSKIQFICENPVFYPTAILERQLHLYFGKLFLELNEKFG